MSEDEAELAPESGEASSVDETPPVQKKANPKPPSKKPTSKVDKKKSKPDLQSEDDVEEEGKNPPEEVKESHQPQDGSEVLGIVGRRQLQIEEIQATAMMHQQPEEERSALGTLLDLQKQRDSQFFEYLIKVRKLEIEFENIYKPLYDLRAEAVFPGFWLKVLKNNALVAKYIEEKDEDVLKSLTNIKSVDDPTCDNYLIEFHFDSNPYFSNQVLTKSFNHDEDQILDVAQGTDIIWKKSKDGKKSKDLTKEEKTVTVNKKAVKKIRPLPSFFHFFDTSSVSSDVEKAEKKDLDDIFLGRKETDEELGVEFRDEIVPHALFYYLGVRVRKLKDEPVASDEGVEVEEEEKEE